MISLTKMLKYGNCTAVNSYLFGHNAENGQFFAILSITLTGKKGGQVKNIAAWNKGNTGPFEVEVIRQSEDINKGQMYC